jgi:hypothetical protein
VCWNFQNGRTLRVNGEQVACLTGGGVPLDDPRAGGYCVQVGAGQASFAVMVGIMTLAGYFQLFAEPYVMTQGGPLRSTVSVLYFMYEEGFRWWNLGYASAVAFLLFLIVFAISAGLFRFDRDPEASR